MCNVGDFFFSFYGHLFQLLFPEKRKKEIIVHASFQSRKFSNLISNSNLTFSLLNQLFSNLFSKYIISVIEFARFESFGNERHLLITNIPHCVPTLKKSHMSFLNIKTFF